MAPKGRAFPPAPTSGAAAAAGGSAAAETISEVEHDATGTTKATKAHSSALGTALPAIHAGGLDTARRAPNNAHCIAHFINTSPMF